MAVVVYCMLLGVVFGLLCVVDVCGSLLVVVVCVVLLLFVDKRPLLIVVVC